MRRRLWDWWARVRRSYERGADDGGDERPLTGYALLLLGYAGLTALAAAAVRSRVATAGVSVPRAVDLLLLGVATSRLSRTVAKDAVLAPLRAPFTTYQGPAGPGEVVEAPRRGPVRHAVGELVTCPFCLAQWFGTAGLAALAVAPRTTRWVASGLVVVTVADALQHGLGRLQRPG